MNLGAGPAAGKSLAMSTVMKLVRLTDTPLERLRVYLEECSRARARDEAAGVVRDFAPEERASIATDYVFSRARRGCGPYGPVLGRDLEDEDGDPLLEAIRSGADLSSLAELVVTAGAWNVLVRLVHARGIPESLREEWQVLLTAAVVQEF